MGDIQQNERVNGFNALMLLSLAAILSLPDAYTIAGALFAIVGFFYFSKRMMTRKTIFEPHLAGKLSLFFMAYAFICAGIQFWHDAPISYYEMYIPFLWAPLIVLAVLDGRIDRRFIWLGCLLGVFFACLLALYQSMNLGIDRPNGFLGSPITFGNNALLLGAISLAGRHDPPFTLRKPVWLALSYLGFFFGLTASLISQSKGGWPLIPVVLIWVLVEDFCRASRRGKLSLSVAAFTFVCLLPFIPLDKALLRIDSAVIGTKTWFLTGDVVEGSASIRLELWQFGMKIWPEKPWLGHSRQGVVDRLREEVSQNELDSAVKDLTGLHNEIVQVIAEQGLIGLLSWAIIFTLSFLVFSRTYLQHDPVHRALGKAGIITVLASLIFGLSDMNLMLNANRQLFVFFIMIFSALIVADKKKGLT